VRWVSRILLGMAIVLMAGIAVFWVRGYWWADRFSVNLSNTRQVSVVSHRGYLYLASTKLVPVTDADVSFMTEGGFQSVSAETAGLDADQLQPKLLIFRWLGISASFGSFYCFGVPSWFVLGGLAALVVVWRIRQRRRRMAAGRGFAVEQRE